MPSKQESIACPTLGAGPSRSEERILSVMSHFSSTSPGTSKTFTRRRSRRSFRPGNDIPGAAAFHAQFMGTDGWFTFVAESGDALIGYITLEHQSQSAGTFRVARNRLYVHQLSVHPAHRRTGVGAALMRRAEECASELRATEVTLDTWAFNAAAQAFFTALGYNVYNYRLRKGLGE